MKTPETLLQAVEQFKDRDAEAFNRIYEESYKYLYTCIMHVMKDEDKTMDMLQETYLEISRSISQLGQPEKFLSWAATIANRKCFANLKKFSKDVLVDESSDEEDGKKDYFENIPDNEEFIPESILQDREKQRLIREIIDDLSDMQRLCVIGFYYNEFSQEEIAKELGIPVNTVKSHLNRAKSKIKDAVIELDEKKGTRLYSVAPFMLLVFREEIEACVIKPMPANLLAAVANASPELNVDQISKLKAAGTKAAMAGKTKIIIGAVACVGAGVVALTSIYLTKAGRQTEVAETEIIEPEIIETEATELPVTTEVAEVVTEASETLEEPQENAAEEVENVVDEADILSKPIFNVKLNGEELKVPCKMGDLINWGRRNGFNWTWRRLDTSDRRIVVCLYPLSENAPSNSLLGIDPNSDPVISAAGLSATGEDCLVEDLICYDFDVTFYENAGVSVDYQGLTETSSFDEFSGVLGTPMKNESPEYDWLVYGTDNNESGWIRLFDGDTRIIHFITPKPIQTE